MLITLFSRNLVRDYFSINPNLYIVNYWVTVLWIIIKFSLLTVFYLDYYSFHYNLDYKFRENAIFQIIRRNPIIIFIYLVCIYYKYFIRFSYVLFNGIIF